MRPWILMTVSLVLATTGCSGSEDGGVGGVGGVGCPDGGTGELIVNISDGGVTPSVQVSGPGGFTDTLTATDTLSGLTGGRYLLLAETVATPASGGDLAGSVFSAGPESVVEVCVRDGETATVDLAYSEHPGSGMLWVVQTGLADNDVVAFDQSKLTEPGSQTPDILIDLASGNPSDNLVGLAFDRWGNLWLAAACTCGDRLIVLTPGQLATGGNLDPARVVLSSALAFVRDITLDPNGNLWASNGTGNTVVQFSAEQLAAVLVASETELTESPAITIESGDFDEPGGIEFDSTGNLWVADQGNDAILQISAAELTSSGTRAAARTITGDTPSPVVVSLAAPVDLVFQPDGDLWVSYLASNVLARYTPADLATSGNYEPNPQTEVPVSAIPQGIAADAQGGVWSAQFELRLQRTGAAEYTVTSNELGDPQKLTFYPAP